MSIREQLDEIHTARYKLAAAQVQLERVGIAFQVTVDALDAVQQHLTTVEVDLSHQRSLIVDNILNNVMNEPDWLDQFEHDMDTYGVDANASLTLP